MKKKKLLLILPISFFLCSCNLADVGIGQFKPFSSEFWQGLSIFGWQPFGGKNNNDNSKTDPPIEDVDVDENKHANSISADPSAPFYLKVDEKRQIKVTLSPSTGLRDEEKTFTWKIAKGNGVSIPSGVTGNAIEVTAIKASSGNVITATNDYNPSLNKSFTINVIDFDEENDYLWQYDAQDKYQFGYTGTGAEEARGNDNGEVVLNGITWSFLREPQAKTINVSQSGCIGFGSGGKPETHLHFETEVDRTVEKITIEASSANSLGKMSISVGETSYMTDAVVPKVVDKAVGFLSTDDVETPVSGKIQIDVNTPDPEPGREDDPDYEAPGAFFLKSILIHFGDTIEPATVANFDFKDMYDNRAEDDGKFGNLDNDWQEVKFTDSGFDLTFEKVKKEANKDEKIPGYAHTNGYIDIKLNNPDEEIYKVEFKIEYGETADSSKSVYSLETSKSGGAPFTSINISSDKVNAVLNATFFKNNHINAIRLKPSRNTSIGLDYLKISTKSGINPTIASITPPAEFSPTVTEYNEGDEFSLEGLGDLTISYTQLGVESDALPASELDWYDGVYYDKDPRVLTKELVAGTEYVYGVFRDEIVATVSGLTVVGETTNLTLVKNASELEPNYKYLIVGKFSGGYTCLNGAGTTNDTIKSGYVLSDFVLNDKILISKTLEARAFTASFDSDSKLHFQNSNDNKIALNSSGITFSKTATNDAWDFVIDSENHLVMTLDDKEFGVNNSSGVFSAYSSTSTAKGSIYLYKFA